MTHGVSTETVRVMLRLCGRTGSRSIAVALISLASLAALAASANATVTTEIGVSVGTTGGATSGGYFASSVPGPPATIGLSVVRNGVAVASTSGSGFVYLNATPSVGDTVQVEKPLGTAFQSVVYDGKPTVDATTCIGSTAISG